MATVIARSTVTDDDGSGTVGTIWDAASLGTIVYDKVDGILSTNVVIGGTVDSESSAEDSIHVAGGVQERGRSVAMGIWTAVAHATTNHDTSSSNSTWAVSSGDQYQYSYMLLGKTLFLNFDFRLTSVGGTPTEVWLDLPSGYTVGRSITQPMMYEYEGVATTEGAGWISATSGGDHLAFRPSTHGDWPATTDNSEFFGMAIVPIA